MSDTPPATDGASGVPVMPVMPVARDASVQLQLSIRGAPTPEPSPPPPAASSRASWLTPVTVPIVVAIVALVAPVTTAVNAHYQAALKLELDRQAQMDERTRLYLERAIGADAGAESRRQTLRFLVIQRNDEALKTWAAAELVELDAQVPALKAEEAALTAEVVETRQEVAALGHDQEQLTSKLAIVAEPARVAVKQELAEVNRQLDAKRILELEKSNRLSKVGVQLHGPQAMQTPGGPLCARYAFFNPVQPADFELSVSARRDRARTCDRSVVARVPPADAVASADDTRWLWQLPGDISCGCNRG